MTRSVYDSIHQDRNVIMLINATHLDIIKQRKRAEGYITIMISMPEKIKLIWMLPSNGKRLNSEPYVLASSVRTVPFANFRPLPNISEEYS